MNGEGAEKRFSTVAVAVADLLKRTDEDVATALARVRLEAEMVGGGDADRGGGRKRVRWAGVALPVLERLCHWIWVGGCPGGSNRHPQSRRKGGSGSERVSGWGERKQIMREGLSRGLEADSKYVVEGVSRLRSAHRLCSCKLKVKMR